MDQANYRDLAERFPAALSRATLLRLFTSSPVPEIPDPYSATLKQTDGILAAISDSIDALAVWVTSTQTPGSRPRHRSQLRFLWIIDLDYASGMRHGGNLRWFNLSREVIALGHFAYFLVNRQSTQDPQAMRDYLDTLVRDSTISGYFIIDAEWPTRRSRLASWIAWPPLTNRLLHSVHQPLASQVSTLLATHHFDVCVIGERRLLFLLPTLEKQARVLIDWGDSFVLYYGRQILSRLQRWSVRDLIRDVRDLVAAYLLERYYGRRSHANLVVSPVDKHCLDRVNRVPSRNHLILNGFRFPAQELIREKLPRRIVFTGNMNFPPNYEAALWFINHVMPIVCRVQPDAEFVVAGRNPVPELQSKDSRNVKILGCVDDIHHEIAKSSVYVAPLISGGGFKNKILEAISSGTFVVATSRAVEFLDAELRHLLLIGNNPQEMAAHVLSVLDHPDIYEQRIAHFRLRMSVDFTWAARAADLVRLART
jgi:glycosyltransferase involved in cell wall biosynthesis